jgi:hypothetical protein
VPLDSFRKDAIGSVKEKKKQHDKKTAKFCQAQEKILNLSSKKPETVVVEVQKKVVTYVPFKITITIVRPLLILENSLF